MTATALPTWVQVALSLLVALVLTVIPLPAAIGALRPAWVVLVIVFWNTQLPRRVGVTVAWIAGLLLDQLTGTVLGEHALALTLVSFAALKLHELVRTFPLWQQGLALVPVFVGYEFVLFWVDGVTGHAVAPLWRWAPVISTTLLWPIVAPSMELFTRL